MINIIFNLVSKISNKFYINNVELFGIDKIEKIKHIEDKYLEVDFPSCYNNIIFLIKVRKYVLLV